MKDKKIEKSFSGKDFWAANIWVFNLSSDPPTSNGIFRELCLHKFKPPERFLFCFLHVKMEIFQRSSNTSLY